MEIKKLVNESDMEVVATKAGLQEVGQAKQAFGEIQGAVYQLREHNSEVNSKVFNMTSISGPLRQLSQPISENRLMISDGLDAALCLVEHLNHHAEKISG